MDDEERTIIDEEGINIPLEIINVPNTSLYKVSRIGQCGRIPPRLQGIYTSSQKAINAIKRYGSIKKGIATVKQTTKINNFIKANWKLEEIAEKMELDIGIVKSIYDKHPKAIRAVERQQEELRAQSGNQ